MRRKLEIQRGMSDGLRLTAHSPGSVVNRVRSKHTIYKILLVLSLPKIPLNYALSWLLYHPETT